MAEFIVNHQLAFRPLRGGIAIYNAIADEFATLGFIARPAGSAADAPERWIVTAFHALRGKNRAAVADGEALFQPFDTGNPADLVARFSIDRMDADLDCAACRVLDGVACVDAVLGLGRVGPARAPQVDMPVVKSGLKTGITEGVITEVTASQVTIVPSPSLPADYNISGPADSGALWMHRDTHEAVALHRAGNPSGGEFALATPIELVLDRLGLEIAAF